MAKVPSGLASAGTVRVIAVPPKHANQRAKKGHLANALKPSSASGGPGTVRVRLKPTGPAKATLKRNGKLKIKVSAPFTPNGSDPNTKPATLKLKTRRKG